MVKIRLKRLGSIKRPVYRIVVIDSRTRRDGSPIEEIGFYNPRTEPVELRINQEAAQKWISQGAQASETVKSLIKKAAAATAVA